VELDVWDYPDYTNSAATRVYRYFYLDDNNHDYSSRNIRNRLIYASVQLGSDSLHQLVLVSNCYDNTIGFDPQYGYFSAPGCTAGALSVTPGAPNGPSPNNLYLHDDTNFGPSFTFRGNLTRAGGLSGMTLYAYYTTGVVYQTVDGAGAFTYLSTSSATTFSLPSTLTPAGDSNMATSISYAGSFAVTSVSGPNSATSSTQYDASGWPTASTIVDGAVTTYCYTMPQGSSCTGQSASANPTQIATLGNRFKKTTLDGFGRVLRVETGHDGQTISQVDTQYAACACSPLGKLSRVSKPYAPNGTPIWTTYSYDASGRTISVQEPDQSKTSYAYQGAQTTVMDAVGYPKGFTNDAFGNLALVSEPNPAGGSILTQYTYNGANQLLNVCMPVPQCTQTRSFVWAGTDLGSSTNPENGTFNYLYDGAHRVISRTDAKIPPQQTIYCYDGYYRLAQVRHYSQSGGSCGDTNDLAHQRVTYYYDGRDATHQSPGTNGSQNYWGRLTATQFPSETWGSQEQFQYLYSYNQAGRVIIQQLQMTNLGNTTPQMTLEADYAWDNEGKMTAMQYPGDGIGGGAGSLYTYQFDSMARLSGMLENGNQVATITGYGPANEIQGLTYYGVLESRQYNSRLQLTRMTASGAASMDMEYVFDGTGHNNGRITQSIDHLSVETVQYTYDSLNRLVNAYATNGAWSQAFSYDMFGNLTGKTGTGAAAQTTYSTSTDSATNRQGINSPANYDNNGNPSVSSPYNFPYDVENRLLQPPGAGSWSYDPAGHRTFLGGLGDANSTCELYFYAITGKKIATYTCGYDSNGVFSYIVKYRNVYFGGKLIRSIDSYGHGATVVTDRLGSVRANSSGERLSYFAYGEERGTSSNSREKFGTYFRGSDGVDYADQRYYTSAGGRFLTPDPSTGSTPASPGSWNKYAYAGGDPLNFADPSGNNRLACDVYTDYGCAGRVNSFDPGGVEYLASYSGEGDWDGSTNYIPPSGGVGDPIGGGGAPDPEPMPVSDKIMLQEWIAGLNRAAQALLNNPNCSTLFGWTGGAGNASPSSIEGIIGVLSNISNSYKFGSIPSPDDTVTSATTTGVGSSSIAVPNGTMLVSAGVVITVNNTTPSASFVSGNVNDWAATILHELGHAYWDLYGPGTSLIVPDSSSTATSMANSALVRQRCGL
jgi:RHS repeat-associated protein